MRRELVRAAALGCWDAVFLGVTYANGGLPAAFALVAWFTVVRAAAHRYFRGHLTLLPIPEITCPCMETPP